MEGKQFRTLIKDIGDQLERLIAERDSLAQLLYISTANTNNSMLVSTAQLVEAPRGNDIILESCYNYRDLQYELKLTVKPKTKIKRRG